MYRPALDEYNKLFKAGKLNFGSFDLAELPKSTQHYLAPLAVAMGISFKMRLHRPVIDNEYLFIIDNHPTVRYFIHDAVRAGHMFGDVNFENMPNNQALAELSGIPGVKELFDTIDGVGNN